MRVHKAKWVQWEAGRPDLWVTVIWAGSVLERIYSHLGGRSREEDVDGNENTTSAQELLFLENARF